MMKRNKKNIKYKSYLIVLATLILIIGIGYAYLQRNLIIGGDIVASKDVWDVHFETIDDSSSSLTSCSGTAVCSTVKQKATIVDNKKAVTFSVNFNKVGDYYEFTVDAVNAGTIDAMIESVIADGISTDNTSNFEVSYKYTDGCEIGVKDTLKKKSTRHIVVRVTYIKSLDKSTDVNFKFKINYIKDDGTGQEPVNTKLLCKSNQNIEANGKLCKRASTLHTEVCNQTSNFCRGAGHSTGEDIIYGNCGTSGELTSGDAFDCDVDGNGVYDSKTERFYYVSDYYDTTTNTFNSDYATLIYYNNVKEGIPDNTVIFPYGTFNETWHGPVTGYIQLPSTREWSKVTLLKNPRQLLNEKAETTIIGATLETFDYTDRAARLLTYQEINNACDVTAGNYGDLDKCEYLLENTQYSSKDLLLGWLTESVHSSTNIWYVNSGNRNLTYHSANRGIRPAIDVAKSNISY